MSFLRLPAAGIALAILMLMAIDRLVMPLHSPHANREGILAVECLVLLVLLGAAVWDKAAKMRRTLQAKPDQKTHDDELFTWNEIAKLFACLAASMVIFVAVVKVLELNPSAEGLGHQGHEAASIQ